ncbi:hypothetical protein Tco_1053026, partial [Tanacetum coccineum]
TQISSIGEGFSLEDDDLDCYDGYDAQVYNLSQKSQEFCDNQMEELLSLVNSVELSVETDVWNWSLSGDGIFSVSSVRIHVDEGLCIMDGPHTRWSKLVPIKVNILAWEDSVE